MKIKRKPKTIIRRKKPETERPSFEPFRHAYVLLVHSFLYYKLDESVITDSQYDQLAKLVHNNLDKLAPDFPYLDLFEGMGTEGSLYYIKEYPAPVCEAGLRALHYHKKLHGMTEEPFHIFISRYGFHIKGETLNAKTEDSSRKPSPKRLVRKRRA